MVLTLANWKGLIVAWRLPLRAGLPPLLGQALALAAKDLRAELRAREISSLVLVFALLVMVIFNFTLDLQRPELKPVATAMLWVAVTLAAVLGLGHVFAREGDQGSMDGLLLCPVERPAIYLGKFLATLALTLAMEVAVLPVFTIFTNQGGFQPGVVAALALGTVGFVAVGTLFAAISSNARVRELMLPILLFPVVTPVLIAGGEATQRALAGEPWSALATPLGMLVAFDVVFLALCPLLFEYVVEEAGS